MPPFDNKSNQRISKSVQWTESQQDNTRPGAQKYPANIPLVWFLLIEDFDEDREALGAPGNWSASADNVGDGTGTPVAGGGFLTADPVARYVLRDTTGHIGASEGSWVCCRPLGTDNGNVWEPVCVLPSYDRISGLATTDVAGVSFTIDNVGVISGTDPREDPSSTSEAVSIDNPFTFTIDNNGRVHAEYNITTKTWQAYQAACPA